MILVTIIYDRRMHCLTNYFLVRFDYLGETISSNNDVETTMAINFFLKENNYDNYRFQKENKYDN